jgi:hypothetical protein
MKIRLAFLELLHADRECFRTRQKLVYSKPEYVSYFLLISVSPSKAICDFAGQDAHNKDIMRSSFYKT